MSIIDSHDFSPKKFYKNLRPEKFSDSEIVRNNNLTKELLAFELEKITTNQKENQFEVLARKMAEKLISPNLIPQVGPTGGGDGKTDSETYPVSEFIQERWFIPENGWSKDEKWAFAISATEQWKGKLKKDIKSIISTNREYTRIYFITNQTPSSKKKKDAQDEFIKEFKIDIVILDGVWLLEKTFSNNLINLVVSSLNLSEIYKQNEKIIGSRDRERQKRLDELENDIQNPNRYFEYDFQLIEDALESAIISRNLEKSRFEVEGKFNRVEKLLQKTNNNSQKIRLKYQKAWTYINYYDDFDSFLIEFDEFKKVVKNSISISFIEYYITLFTLFNALCNNKLINISQKKYKKEENKIFLWLSNIGDKSINPSVSLVAKSFEIILKIYKETYNENECNELFITLKKCLESSKTLFEFPFELFEDIIMKLGDIHYDSNGYEKLFEILTEISEKRESRFKAGELYIKRGGQMMKFEKFDDALIYFGKAVNKLAKEETQYGFYLSLMGLSAAYKHLGLYNASYSASVSAISVLLKSWFDKGKLDSRLLKVIENLFYEEILYGRLPHILSLYELYKTIHYQQSSINFKKNLDPLIKADGFLSVRIINTEIKENVLSFLPDIFKKEELLLCEDASLFKLGCLNEIMPNYKKINIKNHQELEYYFDKVANQPLIKQFYYKTNFLNEDKIFLTSKILGVDYTISFKNSNKLIIIAETILAYIESFFASSLNNDIFPNSENIEIILEDGKNIYKTKKITSNKFLVVWDSSFHSVKNQMQILKLCMTLVSNIFAYNFLVKEPKLYIKKLFEKDEVHERLSIILNHKIFVYNVFGNPKLTFSDWKTSNIIGKKMIREKSYQPKIEFEEKKKKSKRTNKKLKNIPHNKRKIHSIIDNHVWDKAEWKGVGFTSTPSEMFVFLIFKDKEYGIKIFEDWIKKFGVMDDNNQLKISFITGINKNKPYWYRVFISKNIENILINDDSVLITTSRFHEMNAESDSNIKILKNGYKKFKRIKFLPAFINKNNQVEVSWNKSIIKKELTIIEAWKIDDSYPEVAAIKDNDEPIIPINIKNIPFSTITKKMLE